MIGETIDVLTVEPDPSSFLADDFEGPTTGTEAVLAEVLAAVMKVDRVSVDSHFFDDLGADSMVMARFCARLRKRADLPSVSMKDIYQHPTIRSIAVAFPVAPPATSAPLEGVLAGLLAEVVGVDRVTLDSHFFDDLGADSMVMARFCARVRKRADLPSVSMKDIYQHPTIRSIAVAFPVAPPATSAPLEGVLAGLLAEVVGVDRVTLDSHFFDDLDADSMVMARFCARVRKRADLPSVSMKDIYAHPTISSLAVALADTAPAAVEPSVPASIEVTRPASTAQYVFCGALQFLFFVGYSFLAALLLTGGYEWASAGSGVIEIYVRAVLFGGAGFLGMCALPILAKWVLVGRWKPQQIRIWSLSYVRFWLVKTLVRSNPLVMFVGSPLYVLYLRALGAKIGRGVAIFSRSFPVCTDLLSIGDGTVIRKDSHFTCYRAHAGMIQIGSVTMGRNVVVSEATVLDIGTSLGDGAQLGHASALYPGQAVPAGERWHGSPAQRTDVDFRAVPPTACGMLRRFVFTVVQLLNLLVLYLPLGLAGAAVLFAEVPQLAALLNPEELPLTSWAFYSQALIASLVLYFGALLVALLVVTTVPRLFNLAIEPDKIYRLYGFHYWVHRTITRMTNVKPLSNLFGDCSYIVHYLRGIGYDLSRVKQTGSNFGGNVKHETPYLSSVGTGTMVADGLSIINAHFSTTSFRVSRASIGPSNFLGNGIAYPSQSRTGNNCLLATKVMVPIDGEIREGVGLLGSPSFEIPRSVERDNTVHPKTRRELRVRLAAKNKHNIVTMGWHLLVRWIHFFGITLLASVAASFYTQFGASVVALFIVLILLFTAAYFVLVERVVTGFKPLRPLFCSIYEPAFWRHERYWKVCSIAYLNIFSGTPFKNVISRLLGVRIGHRVFDDGCGIPERSLVTIGDDCTLNMASAIQCHSQEDAAFKSDYSTIGAGCTLGIGSMVHYGVTVGDGAVLAPDSFLMKGEEVPPYARWGGNPARELRDLAPAAPTVPAVPTSSPARRRAPLLLAGALVPLIAAGTVVAAGNRALEFRASSRPSVELPPDPSAVAPRPSVPPSMVAAPVPAGPPPTVPPTSVPVPNRPLAASTAPPFRLADVPHLDVGLASGSEGPVVVTLQRQLQGVGYYAGPAHGRFDEPTAEAVRRFQAETYVFGDRRGTAGRATAVALLAAGPRPPLAHGATGEDVHRLQHALVVALGRPVSLNGSYLAPTQQAVADYQFSRGLPVDGTVTEQTWTALQGGR
ncbi:Pls/PosA family non-ribosomal peptide synthetase [Pseudonocardia nigra]|uniref:Pls/PosA family non-ribosomal peptide synthetase n=1 Tax=Pseudonocardia nigra TaxID=1921578 RepID=UPI0027E3746F|nr:Pls/PosA family non-ribosomal peptide synthetase [Pseudonocardia nigra]